MHRLVSLVFEQLHMVAPHEGGVFHALAALGLWTMQPFGRAFQKLLAFGWLFLVPFGTVYALVVFVLLGWRIRERGLATYRGRRRSSA